FVHVQRSSGRVAGSTRFGNITREHRRAEIGWTWLGLDFQRTALNTEAKYLMLRHAFEVEGCMRVERLLERADHRPRPRPHGDRGGPPGPRLERGAARPARARTERGRTA